MTDTRDCHHHPSSDFSADSIKLASSTSEQNVYFTYVCLVNGIKPGGKFNPEYDNVIDVSPTLSENEVTEDRPIQVERSKALHELAESYKRAELDEITAEQPTVASTRYPTSTSGEDSAFNEISESTFLPCANPNVLELTKMKWLTEDPDDGPDSSSPSVSPNSSSSNCSQVSECELEEKKGLDDKYLSTILRLDKEHNLFGLSNIAIVGAKPSKVKRKEDEKAVFHQTAIVQICCSQNCCKHRSNTDLPSSLKCCGGCRSCCIDPCHPCGTPCDPPFCCGRTCSRVSSTCSKGKCCYCKVNPCPPYKCTVDCNKCYGLQIKLNRKPVFEEPKVELTPRSSCIMLKPISARACTHSPPCCPPSPGFPYLLPCYWPARPSAPCSVPARCFHNPPCLAARKPTRVPVPPEYICSRPCVDTAKNTECHNDICPGDPNEAGNEEIETKEKKRKNKRIALCECSQLRCASCFVLKPEKKQVTHD